MRRGTRYQCKKCQVRLFFEECFEYTITKTILLKTFPMLLRMKVLKKGVEVSYEEDEVKPHMAWDTPQNTDSNDSSEFDDSIELQILFNNIQ